MTLKKKALLADEADGLAILVDSFFSPTEDQNHSSKVIKVLLSWKTNWRDS